MVLYHALQHISFIKKFTLHLYTFLIGVGKKYWPAAKKICNLGMCEMHILVRLIKTSNDTKIVALGQILNSFY